MSFPGGFQKFDSGIPGYSGYQAPTMDRYQQDLYRKLIQGISANPAQLLSQMAAGDDSFYAPQEQQALRQFREEVMPSIGSRFVGRLGGSAAQGAFARAGSDLTQDLYAERAKMRQAAIRDLASLEDQLLNKKTFEREMVRKPSAWEEILKVLPAIGRTGGSILGGFTNPYKGINSGLSGLASNVSGIGGLG